MIAALSQKTTKPSIDAGFCMFDFADHVGFDRDYRDYDFGEAGFGADLIELDCILLPVVDSAETNKFWSLQRRIMLDLFALAHPFVIPSESSLIPRSQLPIIRAEMATKVETYWYRHVSLDEIELEIKEFNKKQRGLKAKGLPHEEALDPPSALPPFLLNAPVGAGKSQLIQFLSELSKAAGLPLAVLAPTHDLCDAICSENKGMAHYYGRVDEDDDKGRPQNICYKKEVTEAAASNNHSVAAELCIKCENGQAGAIKHGKPADENVIKAIQWFETRKLDHTKIKPCRFLYEGLPAQLAQPRLVAPHGAFSEAIGLFNEKDYSQSQRLIIVDEEVELTDEIEITISHIDQWINNVDSLSDSLSKRMAVGRRELNDETAALLALLPRVRQVFVNLSAAINSNTEIDFKSIIEIKKAVAGHGSNGGTARWERIARTSDGDFYTPLRALNTLANNAQSGTLRRQGTKLYFFEIKPILKWAIERGSVIFLDATASTIFKDIIRASKGTIFERRVDQNMSVIHVSGHLYSRGRTPTESADADHAGVGDSYRRAARGYMKEIAKIAEQLPPPGRTGAAGRAIITHKAFLKYAGSKGSDAQQVKEDFEARRGCKIGWFGKHDRGHNDWKYHHIAVVGMPLLSSDNIASAWGRVRAAAAEAGIDLPVWDGLIDTPENSKRHHNGVYLPLQAPVRAFLLDYYAAAIAQAIGRARALNSDDLIYIELWGGLQTDEFKRYLLAHGVEVGGSRENDIHKSARTTGDYETFQEALEMVQSIGRTVSKSSIRDVLVGMKTTMDNNIILAQLTKARADGRIPPASKGGRPPKPETDLV